MHFNAALHFDGNQVKTYEFPANEESKPYFIAHELTHVVSFLNSGITDGNDWVNRKTTDAGWVDFFNETYKMQEVYHGLLLDGFTPKQIIETFRTFFYNTEEARNVLGLVKVNIDGQETLIGEGEMFKEQNPFDGIVTYLNESRQPNAIEQAILRRLTDDRYLTRAKPNKQDAVMVLGSQFVGFDLVNAPRENSAIAAIKKVNPRLNATDFSSIQNSIEEATNNYALSAPDITRDAMRQQTEIDHLQDMASLADRDIVLIRSDDNNPQNYTFKFFDANGFNTYLQDENIKSIFEKNPNTVFIYYNGVNHFQALVPQQPAQ